MMSQLIQLQPSDEHNKELEAHVRPPGWRNPTPDGRYNLVVLGAGTAGLVTAAGAAGLGAKVALVERELMGGDCLNVGCVPSKGVISAARIAATVRNAAEFGVEVPDGVNVNFAAAMQRMRRLRARISPNDSAARFRDLGVDVFLGNGRFHDLSTIDVDGTKLTFKRAVIATGGRASAPRIEGLDGVDYLTNENVFSLTQLPPRLGVIGAGPIGCELAQSFARFGSEVHLFASDRGLMPREDRDAAEIVGRQMQRDGVRIYGTAHRLVVCKEPDGIRVTATGDDGHEIVVDQLLIGVGRAPNVESLNLEAVGVEFDDNGVKVDDRLRTTNPRIFAAGDVCSQFKFTHAADFMARIVIQNALFMGRAKASALTIPWCTYTSPEIAHVGLAEHDAREQGITIDTYVQELADVDRAILEGEDDGFVKVHVKLGTDQIVGATIVAANAGDMISEITLAMTHGLGLKKIAGTIHPYPTQAEAIRRVGDLYNKTRLTPFVKSLFNKWLRWTR
jgi:pyruvate/2-oxoglutarate dehydrogenase complex dihydrolipoamide dehydrogenase (E3) component